MRALGSVETAMAFSNEIAPLTVVCAMELRGELSESQLADALRRLQARHPVLRVRLSKQDGVYCFDPTGTPEIPLTIAHAETVSWAELVEEEMNRRIDAETGPLIRCTYLRGASTWIVVSFHHSIIDGTAAMGLLDELLFLSQGSHGTRETLHGPLPPPADHLFPARFRGARRALPTVPFLARQLAAEVRWVVRGTRRPTPSRRPGRARFLPMTVPAEVTTALRRRAREERVGLNAALLSAVLLAVLGRLYGVGAGGAIARAWSFADLRPYLQPPVPRDSQGCYVSFLGLTLLCNPERGPWELARQVHRRTHRAALRGEKFAGATLFAPMLRLALRTGRQMEGTAALSLITAPKPRSTFGGVDVVSLCGGVSNGDNVLRADLGMVAVLFRGRLECGLCYGDAYLRPEEAQSTAKELSTILEDMAGGPCG
jgi:hypothetical protein